MILLSAGYDTHRRDPIGNLGLETEDFAARAQALGQEYEYPPLTMWAERVHEQASMFQLDALPTTLGQLPHLIEELRGHT